MIYPKKNLPFLIKIKQNQIFISNFSTIQEWCKVEINGFAPACYPSSFVMKNDYNSVNIKNYTNKDINNLT